MDMSEHEWIKHLQRLEKMFRISYPTGTSKEFIVWVCSNYGYTVDAD
jgi:hypothetical protein